MWSKSYSKKVKGVTAAKLWKVWADVDRWHEWQRDLDYARLEGEFKAGSTFLLKPKGGPRVRIEVLKAEKDRGFTDLTRFPLARMFGSHEFEEKNGEVEMTTTIRIEGPLAFLWRKLVAQEIADKLPDQTDWLIERAANA